LGECSLYLYLLGELQCFEEVENEITKELQHNLTLSNLIVTQVVAW